MIRQILIYSSIFIYSCCLSSCSDKVLEIKSIIFAKSSLIISLNKVSQFQQIKISQSNKIIKQQHIDYLSNQIQIDFDWIPSTPYKIEIKTADQTFKIIKRSPEKLFDRPVISLSIPFGQSEIALRAGKLDTISVYQFSDLTSLLKIDLGNTNQKTLRVKLSSFDAIFDSKRSFEFASNPNLADRTAFKQFILNLPETKNNFSILYSLNFDGKIDSGQVTILVESTNRLKDAIQVIQIDHSSSANGMTNGNENPNTIFVNDSFFSQIQSFFGQENYVFNDDDPYTFTAIRLNNSLPYPQIIIADLQVVNTDGTVADGFLSRDKSVSAYSNSSKSSIQIPANSTAILTVPIFVNHLKLNAGEYRKQIKLSLFGFHQAFFVEQYPLFVNQSQWQRFSIFLVFVVMGLIGIIFFLRFYNAYIKNFPVAILITTAIFAAIHFTFTYIAFFLDSTFFAILGPFRTFISSLITDGINASILVSLLLIYPQRGVISLKLFISFLLSAVLTGALYLHNLPSFGLKIMLMEMALIISGFYLLENGFKKRLLTATFLGFASSIMAYYTLLENQVLFRLFYANWYIWSFVSITGFLYNFLAIFLTWNLGLKLRQVIR